MSTPKISVIVPIYNVEKWLHRCIDSILAQTFTDFELLLVDDGSTDASGAICDEYAARDSRVRVFHKPNGGVSSARNLGLDNAQGEWISFVDSDDWIEREYLECLSDGILNSDLSICDFELRGTVDKWPDKIEPGFISSDRFESFITEVYPFCYLTAPWVKLLRRSIIEKNSIRFIESISTIEDTIFIVDYLRYVSNIYCSDRKLYNYWRESNGLSQSSDLLLRQMPSISSALYASLCELAKVRQINAPELYAKILNTKFIAWLFPYKSSLLQLYRHFKKYSYLPEIKSLANVSYFGRKRRIIFVLIKNECLLIAALSAYLLQRFN